jgi:hypothetical protein
MEYISELKSLTGDAFFTLPLLIISFLFFFGTMTSNVGMLYLFLGHLLIAPALSFLTNEKGPFLFDSDSISIGKAIKWFLSMFIFLNVNSASIESLTGSSYSYFMNIFLLIPGIFQFVYRNSTPLSYLNPVAWFKDDPSQTAPPNCSMFPGKSADESKPLVMSSWITHISFFFGFILSNTLQILNRPDPTLSSTPADESERNKKQNALDSRIRNRKLLASSIFSIASIIFLLLLFLRYSRTSCESSFFYSLFPIAITVLSGASWFFLIYSKCGIQPADILGIVQGFIDQDLVDNPIVCVGS